jgi:hypothetical protein
VPAVLRDSIADATQQCSEIALLTQPSSSPVLPACCYALPALKPGKLQLTCSELEVKLMTLQLGSSPVLPACLMTWYTSSSSALRPLVLQQGGEGAGHAAEVSVKIPAEHLLKTLMLQLQVICGAGHINTSSSSASGPWCCSSMKKGRDMQQQMQPSVTS